MPIKKENNELNRNIRIISNRWLIVWYIWNNNSQWIKCRYGALFLYGQRFDIIKR